MFTPAVVVALLFCVSNDAISNKHNKIILISILCKTTLYVTLNKCQELRLRNLTTYCSFLVTSEEMNKRGKEERREMHKWELLGNHNV